jgi:hypothetical protein
VSADFVVAPFHFRLRQACDVLTDDRYVESIPILYSHNTFLFERSENILQLSMSILPQRMDMIRTVDWPWVDSAYYFCIPNINV